MTLMAPVSPWTSLEPEPEPTGDAFVGFCMPLLVVYRILRKLSAWTIGGWYSDVHIEGAENVPQTGPLIVAATHHNEIIDIAVLSVTIPHGRPISFWAKSTMFKHPLARFIMESSGAIRVRRNPNRVSPSRADEDGHSSSNGDASDSADANGSTAREDLFKDTSQALAQGQVVGVFPEGTSYTLPAITQVLPGAAWAAVEYVRAVRQEKLARLNEREKLHLRGQTERTGLKVIPVGIVYEDKKTYLSRVFVQYCEPIDVDSFTGDLFDWRMDPDEAAKSVVKKLNAEIERRLVGSTVNAPDWESLYAARTAMKILWNDEENVRPRSWVETSQNLVDLFNSRPSNTKLEQVRKSLMRYYSLLHYTGIKHAVLEDILPVSSTSLAGNNLSFSLLLRAAASVIVKLPLAILYFVVFIPPFLFHIPGYIASHVAFTTLCVKDEEEAEAEFRSIGGGLGLGAEILVTLSSLWATGALAKWDFLGMSEGGSVKKLLGLFALVYSAVYVLVKWHLLLVKGNLKQFRRLATFGGLVWAALGSKRLRPEQLQMYSKPPAPPANPFIKNDPTIPDSKAATRPPPIPTRMLIRELLTARLQAYINLGNYLRNLDRKEMTVLLSQGARVPSVVS